MMRSPPATPCSGADDMTVVRWDIPDQEKHFPLQLRTNPDISSNGNQHVHPPDVEKYILFQLVSLPHSVYHALQIPFAPTGRPHASIRLSLTQDMQYADTTNRSPCR